MRNGSLQAKIAHHIKRRNLCVVRSADLGQALRAPLPSISRAMTKLAGAGLVEAVGHGIYRSISGVAPVLAFNRAWSNPRAALADDRLIAVTLDRPTFQDVVRLCKAYGINRVRRVLATLEVDGDVSPRLAAQWQHHLSNIETGFRHAARSQFADGNATAIR